MSALLISAPARTKPRQAKTRLFVYGALMNPEQIMIRLCRPKLVGLARLPNFALAFFGHSDVWDSGLETLVERQGAATWGVIYELSTTELDRLDAWQGVKLDGGGSYFHYPIDVIGTDGAAVDVLFHRKDELGAPRPPSREYLDFIIAGAQARALPADYVNELAELDAAPARYAVPKLNTDIKALASKLTCNC